jgi:vanillate O-demethylase monooxygenase subunit
MFVRNAWYVAAWADEISTTPLPRRILNEPVVLFRDQQNRPAALLDMCCHRGAPLSIGKVVQRGIECGYHGLIFDRSGMCVHVPGQDRILERTRVRSFPVVEQDAFIWIWMGDPTKADFEKIVRWPYHNDAVNWPHKHTMYPIKAAAILMVDNLMDLTHLGYVHVSTIGGNPSQHVEAKMEVERTPLGVKYTRWMLNSLPPPTYVKAVGFDRPLPTLRVRRAGLGAAMDRSHRCGRLSRRRHIQQQTGVPSLSRPDAGDRDLVLLLLVGCERFPSGRTRRHRAVLRSGRRRVHRG